jgi:sulfatase maturation enzyme AslB (radical SAM superfamily)
MLQDSFCSSPWFHIRLTYNGLYESCRWAKNPIRESAESIMHFYNSEQMKNLRLQLLNGEQPEHCSSCYYEESFNKLSGRKRQLNKSAINIEEFDLTTRSSPHYINFKYSLNNQGLADMSPVDLQIDLGNICNSSCIMCHPIASSRLETDYKKLHTINPELFKKLESYTPWTRDSALVEKFVNEVVAIPNLRYIHFLGGETLYDPAFYSICDKLIELDIADKIIVGTTTNGTIYNDSIKKYIKSFKQFHLGISIESVTELNDYIRWPGKITDILANITQFLALRESNPELYVSLRVTPNIFSIYEIDKLFVYMMENKVIAESCNILHDPACLRIELLPNDIRQEVKTKIENVIDYYELTKDDIVNVRRTDLIGQVIANVILDYYKFICEYTEPIDVKESRQDLVQFLKAFESIRQNNILDYAPRYKEFLQSLGY